MSNGDYLTGSVTQANMYLNEANRTDSQRGVKMRLGVGDTAPTFEDYCLDETEVNNVDINTVITCSSASVAQGAAGSVLYTFTFFNSSEDTYTIRELCLALSPSTSNLPDGEYVMIARKVITPRTVGARETISFTYEIKAYGGD
jgi:hypothetical protein